jgi:hypothetical protein
MNRAARIIRDLDRAAAIVLAVGLVIFALIHGANTPWSFFAPIFGSFTGHATDLGSLGPAMIADICFVIAVTLFAVARAAGFWAHYSRMPILNWATSEARRRRSAGQATGSPPESAPEEFESEEEYYERVRPQPTAQDEEVPPTTPEAVDEATPAGPTIRSRLRSLWEMLTEQRAQPAKPVPPMPPTRLLRSGDVPSASAQPVAPSPAQASSNTSASTAPTRPATTGAPISTPVPPSSKPSAGVPGSGTDDFESDIFASIPDPATPASAFDPVPGPVQSEDHDFASDPDFHAGAGAGPVDGDDFWPPEDLT